MYSYELREIFKKTFFIEHLWATAPVFMYHNLARKTGSHCLVDEWIFFHQKFAATFKVSFPKDPSEIWKLTF